MIICLGHFREIRQEIIRFFSMMNPFLHLEMDFEQQKIAIPIIVRQSLSCYSRLKVLCNDYSFGNICLKYG
jgi:hypothetical protein